MSAVESTAQSPVEQVLATGGSRFDAKGICAVYFLCDGPDVRYVGQTTDLHLRIRQHRRDKKRFGSVLFIRCTPARLEELEDQWIERLCPPWNTRLPKQLRLPTRAEKREKKHRKQGWEKVREDFRNRHKLARLAEQNTKVEISRK